MKIFNQFNLPPVFISDNSGVRHPKFEFTRPLTVQEIYNRVTKNIPLSIPVPDNSRIPINDKFFVDGFDVLDLAIQNNFRLSEEQKQKQLIAQEQFKKEREEFEAWKLEQQKQHVKETSL